MRYWGAVATALILGVPATASAATITVTGTGDEISANGRCSLREAVQAANTDAAVNECAAGSGADEISLPTGTFKLTIAGADEDANLTGDLDLLTDVTLTGAGVGHTILDGNGIDRVLDAATGTTVTIARLTVTGGLTPSSIVTGPGGGIRNQGTLTIQSSEITGNATGDGAPGAPATGAAASAGAAGNPGFGVFGGSTGAGGGIYSTGPLTVTDTTISGNKTGDGGTGGAGTGSAGGNASAGNTGGAGGAGFGGFGGTSGAGGGIATTTDALTVLRCRFVGNATGWGGKSGVGVGGAGGAGGPTSGPGGGGGAGFGGFGGAAGPGGAISASGVLTVTDSLFQANTTGNGGVSAGGIGGAGGAGGGGNAAGGAGGAGFGGFGGSIGAGGAIIATNTATLTGVSSSGDGTGNGGAGQFGTGGNGGSGAGTAAGGAAGAGFGGFGGTGGDGAFISLAKSSTLTNVTVDRATAGDGAVGGAGTGGSGGHGGASNGNGGPGGTGFGGFGSAGGNGAIVIGVSASGVQALAHLTVSGGRAGSGSTGGPATLGPGGVQGGAGAAGAAGSAFAGTDGADGASGGIVRAAATVTLSNSVISRNVPANCAGTISDGLHNVVFGDTTCPGTVADPKLGAFAHHGGPSDTRPLRAGSPAIDAVPATGSGCPATDQRGVTRPHGAACDAGAFEVAGPDLSGGSADPIGERSATLLSGVNPNGRTTAYHFDYGTTTDYGSRTPDADAGAAVGVSQLSAGLTGLTPGTTYHFRAVVDSIDGSAVGEDHTFTALPLAPPVVTTGPPSAIKPTSGTVTGSVNPNGHATTYHVEYGKTTAYGSVTPDASAGAAPTAALVAVTISGLTAHTVYHYRVVASSEDGTTRGADMLLDTNKGDKVKPVLRKVSFFPASFAIDTAGKPARGAAVKGTKLRFTASEPVRVVVAVSNRKGKTVARFVVRGVAGKNSRPFSGLIKKGKKITRLAPGRYIAKLTPTDLSRNVGRSVRARFRVRG